MAAETELERLVVRLIGDATSYQKMLKDAQASSKRAATEVERAGKRMEAIAKRLNAAGAAMSRLGRSLSLRVTLPLVALGAAAIKVGADFDSGFAGVRKTVNATEAEFADLRKEFKLLLGEIPTDVTELLGIGEIAGQLGIAKGNIISFTKTIAQMGVTTNLTFEEAASDMAKFANIVGMSQDKFSNLGSSIVALGNSTATTERDILSMSMRLAGAGSTIGLTESQITGLAAALSSVGLRSEAGGTAFSKLMLDMSIQVATGGKKIEAFANLTGRSIEEFSDLFRRDAAGAIQTVLKGLSQLDKESRILALKSIGVEGTRMTDAILRASGAVDLLAKSLKTSEDAFAANTALAKEAAVRFKTFWSQVSLLKNQFKLLLTEVFEQLEPTLRKIVEATKDVVKWFRDLTPETKKLVIVIAAVAAAIGPLMIGLGSMLSLVGLAASGIGVFASAFMSLLSPLGLAAAAIVLIGVQTDIVSDTLQWFGDQWAKLADRIKPAMDGIKDAIKASEIKLAIEIMWAEVKLVWAKGQQQISNVWIELTHLLKNEWAAMSADVKSIWQNLVTWLAKKLIQTKHLFDELRKLDDPETFFKPAREFFKEKEAFLDRGRRELNKPLIALGILPESAGPLEGLPKVPKTGAGIKDTQMADALGVLDDANKEIQKSIQDTYAATIAKNKEVSDGAIKVIQDDIDRLKRQRDRGIKDAAVAVAKVDMRNLLKEGFDWLKSSWSEIKDDVFGQMDEALDKIQDKAKIKVDFTVTGIEAVRAGSAEAVARAIQTRAVFAGEGTPRPAPQQAGGLLGPGLKPGETGGVLGKALGEAFVGLLEQKKDTFKDVLSGILEASGLN